MSGVGWQLLQQESELSIEPAGAKESAESANQTKSTFFANMSHELRTPFNAVLLFARVMARDVNLSVQQREHVGIVNRSGELLLSLINDALEMSKIEAGRVTLNEEAFDLHRMLKTVEEMMCVRAEGKGLQLLFEIEQDLPQLVRTDENKLRQVLINLLGNAIKFTEEGGVTLRAGTRAQQSVGIRLLFEVDDTGAGIPADQLGSVFEAFVQTGTGKRASEGTGLRVAISRQFVRLMQGDIRVKSVVGQGSVFTFEVLVNQG